MLKNWKPTPTLKALKQRAIIISHIREFFKERNILEVETPLLGISTATDPFIASFKVPSASPESSEKSSPILYLQTSPEFCMKRLLAAGSGCIYQISKAFRAEEVGRLHSAEFTLLEWYRIGFDHHQLMDEMDDFLQFILHVKPADRLTYAQLFQKHLKLDPHSSDLNTLELTARENIPSFQDKEPGRDKDFWLNLLMTHCIEPNLGFNNPLFVTDFPVSQAALSKIRAENPPVAERFEVYYRGVELANGYHELTDVKEQERRFLKDNKTRLSLKLPQIPLDKQLMAALKSGLPNCAGVALGIDRLVMLATQKKSLKEVSFT